jgi:CBS domain-containing protein
MQTVHKILKHKGDHVYSVDPIETVYEAIAIMAEKEIGALLVMQEGHPVGIISERDYTRKVILKDKSSKATRVSEIMTSELVTVDSHAHIDDCVALMNEHHIRHLPVIDEGVVVGMLSARDLFSAIINEQAHTIEHLEHYVRGEV